MQVPETEPRTICMKSWYCRFEPEFFQGHLSMLVCFSLPTKAMTIEYSKVQSLFMPQKWFYKTNSEKQKTRANDKIIKESRIIVHYHLQIRLPSVFQLLMEWTTWFVSGLSGILWLNSEISSSQFASHNHNHDASLSLCSYIPITSALILYLRSVFFQGNICVLFSDCWAFQVKAPYLFFRIIIPFWKKQ